MAVNIRNRAGADFDTVFALNKSGQYAPNCGFRSSDGVDLSRRYEILSFGTKAPNVESRNSSGVDLSNLWAAVGTPVYALGFNDQTYFTGAFSTGPGQGSVTASTLLQMKSDGTWAITADTGSPLSGTWLPPGTSVSDYQFMFTYTITTQNGEFWDVTMPTGWVDATTTRNAAVSASVDNRNTGQISDLVVRVTVQIRRKSNGSILNSSVCTLSATAQAWV